MPKIPIDASDVESFSKKLEGLDLSGKEAALLSGIFAVAADAISPTGAGIGTTDLVTTGDADDRSPMVRVDDTPPPLSDQFRQQFRRAFVAEPESATTPARPTIIIPAPAPVPGEKKH
jgi:hypothetical protein